MATNPTSELPRDPFSVAMRSLLGNPGAVRASSKVEIGDLLGNVETWIVDTFRVEGGEETILLQRVSAEGGTRLVLPPEVTAVINRQRGRAVTGTRKRAARAAVATRIARGDVLGNPAALAAARASKRTRKRRRVRAGKK